MLTLLVYMCPYDEQGLPTSTSCMSHGVVLRSQSVPLSPESLLPTTDSMGDVMCSVSQALQVSEHRFTVQLIIQLDFINGITGNSPCTLFPNFYMNL